MSLSENRHTRPMTQAAPDIMQLNIEEIRDDVTSSVAEIHRRFNLTARYATRKRAKNGMSSCGAAATGLAIAAVILCGAILFNRCLRNYDG